MYYTYVYLDPRKPGSYSYGSYTFDYEPYYVGKGKGSRINALCDESVNLTINSLKYNITRKILSAGLEPVRLKVSEGLTEDEAFSLEIELIALIGRHDLKTGPLSNMTRGGDGASGMSDEFLKSRAAAIIESRKLSHSWSSASAETREIMSNSQKARWDEVERYRSIPVLSGETIEDLKSFDSGEFSLRGGPRNGNSRHYHILFKGTQQIAVNLGCINIVCHRLGFSSANVRDMIRRNTNDSLFVSIRGKSIGWSAVRLTKEERDNLLDATMDNQQPS